MVTIPRSLIQRELGSIDEKMILMVRLKINELFS
jgi:hypothetical protein